MKNLLILRHASPAPKGPDGSDFSRPLTETGEKEARQQGEYLLGEGIVPDRIVASTAVRARRTAELVLEAMGRKEGLISDDSLYNAPGEELLACVRGFPDGDGTVLLVAHLPGVAELLLQLLSDPGEAARPFAPGTLAMVSLPGLEHWSGLEAGAGTLEWMHSP